MAPTIITSTPVAAVPAFAGGQQYDLCSLADVKLELQISDNANDAWLQKVITRESWAARHYCNRTFQTQTWLDQIWEQLDPYPWQVPPAIMPLQLSQYPIVSKPSPAGTAPPLAPVLAMVAGGSLPAAGYFCRITYVTPSGETAASQPAYLAVAGSNLLTVAPPGADVAQIAIGWNVYIATAAWTEQKQNSAPVGMDASFTLPAGGLVIGEPAPPYMLIVENSPLVPTPLNEGTDFIVDRRLGQVTRLFLTDRRPRPFGLPVYAVYLAPYAEIPEDLQDGVIRLVKAKWFSRLRDPQLRAQTAVGIYEAQYWSGSGPGAPPSDMPPDVMAILNRYRVPVIG